MAAHRKEEGLGYVPAIDGLRAIAVVAVMLFHLRPTLVPGGFLGVDIFFVISGFVVAASVLGMSVVRFRDFLALFYARRLLRIMPALLVCLFVTFVAWALFIPTSWLSDASERVGRAAIFGMSNILLAHSTDGYFSPRAEFNPFTQTWSLGVEEQFYLIFPLLCFFLIVSGGACGARRWLAGMVAASSAATLLVCAHLSYAAPQSAFYMIYARFWELGLGVVLAATVGPWRGWLAARTGLWRPLSVIVVMALATSFLFGDRLPSPFPMALLPVLATGMLLCAVVAWPERGLARCLSSRPMTYVGLRSYSLYLWHWPNFVLFRWTVGLDGFVPVLSALVLTVLMACLSYSLVELPCRHSQLLRRLPRIAVVVGGIASMLASGVAVTVIMRLKPQILLSVTRDADTWFPWRTVVGGGRTVTTDEQAFGEGKVLRLAPHGAGAATGRVIYVLGDSHAGAYLPLLRATAAETNDRVTLFQKGGCASFRFDEPTAEGEAPCALFNRAAMKHVAEHAKAGDVVFLPSLRVPRFGNQWTRAESQPPESPQSAEEARQRAVAEAAAYLKPLAQKGVAIIVEAPKPVFKSPLFRCSDWFNSGNDICRPGFLVSREEALSRAQPAYTAIAELKAAVPGLIVWDPFPILCPDATCSAVAANGKPLIFDGDHISGYANGVLLPGFTSVLAGIPAHAATD